jgi:hypothetical protein
MASPISDGVLGDVSDGRDLALQLALYVGQWDDDAVLHVARLAQRSGGCVDGLGSAASSGLRGARRRRWLASQANAPSFVGGHKSLRLGRQSNTLLFGDVVNEGGRSW